MKVRKKKGWVVSDLHLFANRSDGKERFAQFESELDNCEILVLNGDIFDFRWSTLPSHEATMEKSTQWLKSLLSNHPDLTVHFLLGNHDCFAHFQSALSYLAEKNPLFHWHKDTLQLGPHLFLHGDCTARKMSREAFAVYRQNWENDHSRTHGIATLAYTAADRLGITRFVHQAHFREEATLDRLTYYLDNTQGNWRETVRSCYFGHTHESFSNRKREGISFFNTGSAIKGMPFQPVSFTWGD